MSSDRNVIKQKVSAYANALVNACEGNEQLFVVTGELEQAIQAITESTDLHKTLLDKTIPTEHRVKIVSEVFKDLQAPLVSVLRVLTERFEIDLIYRINDEFSYLAEEKLGAIIVNVVTAVELDDSLRATIKKKLVDDFGQEILLREKVDKSIIGGIIMSTHGKRIDASVFSLLHQTRQVPSTVPTGGER